MGLKIAGTKTELFFYSLCYNIIWYYITSITVLFIVFPILHVFSEDDLRLLISKSDLPKSKMSTF